MGGTAGAIYWAVPMQMQLGLCSPPLTY